MRPVLPFLALAALACGDAVEPAPDSFDPAVQVSPGETFQLRIGQIVAIEEAGLRIAFTDVQDSRCPSAVVCIWEGDGATGLWALADGGEAERIVLHTTLDPKTAVVEGAQARVEITLVKLEPYPVREPIPDEDYLATFSTRILP